jgi:2-haloacid dehalogenase
MMTPLNGIKACVFDAYGTLFDVHSAVARHGQQLGATAETFSQVWRNRQLEYTWLRSLMHLHADFWQVTGDALEYACDCFGITDQDLKHQLMQAYLTLDCYPEVPAVLENLQHSGLTTAILSNGTPGMLQSAVKHSGTEAFIEHILSVESVGVYKPDPRVYRLATEQLNLPAAAICFLSANGWDVAGAAAFGFQVIWINRSSQCVERLPHGPLFELASLHELPQRLNG